MPARRLAAARLARDDPDMTAATEVTQPARHVLALPKDCDCGCALRPGHGAGASPGSTPSWSPWQPRSTGKNPQPGPP